MQRSKVKHEIRKAKQKSWEEFGEKMETNYYENQKLFYRVVKSMRKEKNCPLKFIKDANGKLLTEEGEIMNRWKEYYERLLQND